MTCDQVSIQLNMSDTVNAGIIIVTVLYAITILLSIVGNSSLIYIVWRVKETRSLTSFMFVNMAVADLLITVIMMPVTIRNAITVFGWAISGPFGEVTCIGINYAAETTVMASILCLTIIAIDRFYMVNYPLKSRVAWFRKAKYITPFTWILALALKSIVPVFFHVSEETNRCLLRDVGEDPEASYRAYFTYLFLVTYFLPLCVISILYGLTARTIWFRRTPGNRLTETKQRQEEMEKKRAIRMLVLIVAVFALCWLPVQLTIIGSIVTAGEKLPISFFVRYLAAWLGHSNSAINPWLYICLSPKMKVPFWEMLGRGRRKNADQVIDSRKTTVNTTHEEIPLTVSN